MNTELFRESITKKLATCLDSVSYIHACWLGGSSATGREDKYSDLDLIVIADDDKVEDCFSYFESCLEEYVVLDAYRVPEPCWHGHSQCFYLLEEAPPFFFVDFCVMKQSAQERFLEKERHGVAKVLFDKSGILERANYTYQISEQTIEDKKLALQQRQWVYFLTVEKEILRSHPIDAMHFYHRLIIPLLAELLNLEYRPHKYDFGLRYSYNDFPEHVCHQLESFLYVRDLSELHNKLELIHELMDSLCGQDENSA